MGMANLMQSHRRSRLERSCSASPRDWIRTAQPQEGFARLEAYFAGHGYDPHRHDTYAIGLTLCGVQSFDYRGTTAHSLGGQAIVLHPDEKHDGRAGTEDGFRYRMAYIQPRLMQAALGTRAALPFLRGAVTSDPRLIAALAPALADLETPLEELELEQAVLGIVEALSALDSSPPPIPREKISAAAVTRTREYLDANITRAVRSHEIEAISGLTRFSLARQFRAALGTSPYRYLVMRRLERASAMIRCGRSLAEAALASGFADQSHMTRAFARAYGLPPGRWRQLTCVLTNAQVVSARHG